MSAILFLFSRRFSYLTRILILVTGYDTQSRDFSERLYGVYVVIIVGGSALAGLGFAVTTLAQGLLAVHLPTDVLLSGVSLVFALWLCILPWLAQRSYDIYRFTLSDLDFLSTAPVPTSVVTVAWFVKSLFTRFSAGFVLVCGIIASAVSVAGKQSDILGLALGVFAAASFFGVTRLLVWVLGMLRYQPVPVFNAFAGYGLSLLGAALVLTFPQARVFFWPAWFAAEAVTNGLGGADAGFAALGLLLTLVAGLALLYIVSRTVLLAPAFEEGRLGGQLRRSGGAGTAGLDDPRVQVDLARKLARGVSVAKDGPIPAPRLQGVGGAIVRKQWLRLSRLSPEQALMTVTSLLGIGVVLALGLVQLVRAQLPFQIVIPAIFIANFVLVRFGIASVRSDLAHVDLFVGWPTSRMRVMLLNLGFGFGPPLISGELALLFAGLLGPGWGSITPWLLIWPLLVAASACAALLELIYLLRKWPATPETLPDLGPASLTLSTLIWFAASLFEPTIF